MVSLNGIGGDLTKTEFEIGDTRFFIAKLPAMAGFDLLEAVRHELGKSQALSRPTEVLNEGDRSIAAFLKIVLSLDPAFVRKVRSALFEKVSFSNSRVPAPQQLAGAEEMAFDGLEPIAIYEVLLRSACRWSTIMSVVNRSGKMSVHERIDIDPERTGKAPSAQRYPGRSDISG